jgi:transposase-like protein
LRRVDGVSAAALGVFVQASVESRATVRTDGWRGYTKLAKLGYIHEPTVITSTADPAHVAMPAVHRVAALLKRWLLGTHQGAVSRKHLDYYLDAFAFRFN